MVKTVETNKEFLRRYIHCNHKYKPKIIQQASPEQIRCLCEVTLNVLNCNVPFKKSNLKKLEKHRHLIRKIALHKQAVESKRKLLSQEGSGFFLPLLVSAALSLINK